jgi:hypothetical protein
MREDVENPARWQTLRGRRDLNDAENPTRLAMATHEVRSQNEFYAALWLIHNDFINFYSFPPLSTDFPVPSVVIVLTAFIGILTVVVFWGVEMARGMSQSPGRRADEDAGG